ncbi:MAG: LruC domain-containing protein [Myxococcales bacterium]|nr:LruC domain-containing protein [Myxococcales bacterium]MCB9650021.1 LruC domain-containing protein [Deltaproteobacteria bacterium]
MPHSAGDRELHGGANSADRCPRCRAALPARKSAACAAALVGLTLALGPSAAWAGFDADRDGVWDEIDAYPCDATASGAAFVPAQGDHGLLMFEDMFPNVGDFDFNDVVVSYNYIFRYDRFARVVGLRATFNVLAVGGRLKNGLAVQLPVAVGDVRRAVQSVDGQALTVVPVPGNGNATFVLADELHALYGAPDVLINVDPELPVRPVVTFDLELEFTNPVVSLQPARAPYDVYIFRTDDPSHEVHLPEYRGTAGMDATLFNSGDDASDGVRNFVTTGGIPWVLNIPTLTRYPQEGTSIEALYPDIVAFGASGGTTHKDFYVSNVQAAFAYRDVNGAPAPAPLFLGPDHVPAETSCVVAWGLAVNWGKRKSVFTYAGELADNGDAVVGGYVGASMSGGTYKGGLDVYVARYDAVTGNELWLTQMGSWGDDTARALTTDAAGNIYVVGDAAGKLNGVLTSGAEDAFVVKLDPAGNILWTRLIGSAGNDSGHAVAVDLAGNVYVGGYAAAHVVGATDPGQYPSSFLAKLDGAGNVRWINQYVADPGHPSNYSFTMGVAVDSASDTVYASGTERRYNRSAVAATNPFVIKHRGSDGGILWTHHVGDYGYWNGSVDGRFGYGFGVDVDAFDGAAYLTGSWASGDNVRTWGEWHKAAGDDSPDAFFMKLAPDGAALWSHSLASDAHGEEYAEGVRATGVGGAVYFTGRTSAALPGQTHQGGYDYYVAAYRHDGQRLWVVQDGTFAQDMGHLAASSPLTEQAGTVTVIGNSDSSFELRSDSLWRTAFYQHDRATGARLSYAVAQLLGWSASAWGACSNTCGAGTQSRSVACVYPDGSAAPDALCVSNRPAASASCYDDSGCAAKWSASAWSSCSAACGKGVQTRNVSCVDAGGAALPASSCLHMPPPATSQSCGDYSACAYAWATAEWGACQRSSTCGTGVQHRSVYCARADGAEVADALCGGNPPATQQACADPACTATQGTCAALLASGVTASGRYDLDVDGPGGLAPVNVYCDMSSFGGGWTNLDFAANRVWLSATDAIECATLTQGPGTVTCERPRFNAQEGQPLFLLRCDGSDRSGDYLLEQVAPLLGHAGAPTLGYARLKQAATPAGGASVGDAEYCYAAGQILHYSDPACEAYAGGGTNGPCVAGYFTLER